MIKKTLLSFCTLLLCYVQAISQIYPQYEFYSNYDISSLTGGVKNCVEEAECIEYTLKLYEIANKDSISEGDAFMASLYAGLIFHNNNGSIDQNSDLKSILYKVALLNDSQRIDLLSRLYEIENTCYIKYSTEGGQSLNFTTYESESNSSPSIDVDFGSSLIYNTRNTADDYSLKFANPITRIDANLFSSSVKSIILPNSKDLVYLNNARKDVSNLSHIEGRDVKFGNVLISRDSVLVVAAVAGQHEFSVPSSVKVLGRDCLRNCNLTIVTIPESVYQIQSGAFENCSNMLAVYIRSNSVIEIDENAFDDINSASWKIYVPKRILKSYKKAYPILRKRLVAE